MYTTYFIIPKAVYFYCIVPAIAIIIASIIFGLIYHKKKGTHYYIYTMNYVYNFVIFNKYFKKILDNIAS